MRQLWDGKGSFALEAMDASAWPRYAQLCAWTLARAHARTGDRIAIAGYLGDGDTFDRAVADFAAAYADQNCATTRRSPRRSIGRVKAETGV